MKTTNSCDNVKIEYKLANDMGVEGMKGKFKSFLSCILIGVMLLGIYKPYNIYATETDEIMTEETTQMPVEEDTDSEGEASEEDDEKISVTQITAFEDNEIFQNPIYVDNETPLEEIVATFPDVVIAFDDKENKIEISNVEWTCQDEIEENWSELKYSFTLPEIYALGEGVQIPTITICREQSEISVLSEDEGNATEVEDGTEAHPYLIYTYDDFEKVRQHLESGNYFKLMNDIDAERIAWLTISSDSSNPFCGNFDGNGHCIYNLKSLASNYGYGIFGYIKEASIHDLGVRVKDGMQITAKRDAGILCKIGQNASISRCYIIGDLVTNYMDAECVGLIAGIFSGNISECYTQGYVYSYGNRSLGRLTSCVAGGIVGSGSVTIENCISYAKVETATYNDDSKAGGILGSGTDANITNCLFLGETIGGSEKILGQIYGVRKENKAIVSNTFFSKGNSYNAEDELYGTGKDISELRQQSTYVGWDFENVWTMEDKQNAGFPMLRCMENISRNITTYIKPTCVGYSISNHQTLLTDHVEFKVYFDRNIVAVQNEAVYLVDALSGEKIQCQYKVENEKELLVETKDFFVNGHNYKLYISNNCIFDEFYPDIYYVGQDNTFKISMCKEIFEGSGTKENPYVIKNVQQLNCVFYQPAKCYVLANDIDASTVEEIYSIGEAKSQNMSMYGQEDRATGGQYHPFTGVFDGQGHTISGIKKYNANSINGDGYYRYAGLFASTKDCTIKNLNIVLSDDFYKYDTWTGTFVSYVYYPNIAGLVAKGTGTISNCTVSGNILTTIATGATGLLAAEFNGIIQNCATYGSVTNGYNASGYYAGGLVGKLGATGTIKDSYSMAAVYGAEKNTVGGLVGMNNGLIANTYSAGYVSKQQNAGGLVGNNKGSVNNSYYDSLTTGMIDNDKGIPKISSAMKTAGTYYGWDFDNCWEINNRKNGGYPYLKGGLSADDVTGTQTTIAVIDGADGTKLIANPCITIYENGSEVAQYVGNEEGVITVDGIVTSGIYDVKITAEGYGSYINSMYQIDAFKTQYIMLYPQTDTPTVYCAKIALASAPTEITDVMQKKKTIEKNDTKKYNLEVSATYAGEIDQICLIQDGKVIKMSQNGRFEGLTGKDFESKKPIYIKAVAKDGNKSQLYRTYLVTASEKNFSGSLGEGKISVNVPDDVPILGGYTININDFLNKLKVFEVGESDGILKFTVNLETKVTEENDKKEDDKNEIHIPTFNELQELLEYDKGEGKKNYISKLNQFVDDYNEIFCEDNGFWTFDFADANKSTLKGKVFGYFEYDMATNKVCGGKLAICVNSSINFENGFMLGSVPCILIIDLSGNVEGSATATLFTEQPVWDVGFDAKLKLLGELGAGVPKLAKATAYGSGELETVYNYNTYIKDYNIKMDLTTDFGWKLKILSYEMSKSWAKKTYHLYNSNDAQAVALADVNDIDLNGIQESDLTVNPIVRDGNWNDSGKMTRAVNAASDVTLLAQVYDNAQPQIVQAGNNLFMFYIHQDSSRTAINATELMYSIYDARRNTWNTPQVLDNDMTADFYPSIEEKGGSVYVTWLNMAENVQDNNMDINSFASLEKISVARYDTATKKFVKCTSNEVGMFTIPQLCADSGKVLWAVNKSENILDNSKTDLVVADYDGRTIGMSKVVQQNIENLIMSKIGVNSTNTEIAYIYDCDGDYATTDDHVLKIIDMDGNVLYESAKSAISDVEFVNLGGKDIITFVQNGSIFKLENYNPIKLLEGNIAVSDQYTIVNGATDYIIFNSTASEINTYAYIYDRNTNKWSNAIPLTDAETKVTSYHAASYGDELRLVYQNLITEQDGTTKSQLHVKTIEPTFNLKINDISWDEATGKFGITIDIANIGLEKASGYQIIIYEGSKEIFSETKNEAIEIGQSVRYENEIETANILGYEKNFDIEIVPLNGVDADDTDNIAEITVGYPDISMEIQNETISASTYYGNLKISNIGNYATDGNVNVYIYDTLVKTIPVAQLQVEETCDLPVEVDMNAVDIQDNVGIVKFEFVSNLREMYLHNNSVTSNIYPSMNATLGAIHASDVKLSAGKTADLNVDFEAASGSKERIAIEPMEYSVDNLEIATVDEGGIVHGNKEGTTTVNITAKDSLGNTAVDTCTITVIAEDDKENTDSKPSDDNRPQDGNKTESDSSNNDEQKNEVSNSKGAGADNTSKDKDAQKNNIGTVSENNLPDTDPETKNSQKNVASKIQDKKENAKDKSVSSEQEDISSERSESYDVANENDVKETGVEESDNKNKTDETIETTSSSKKNIVLPILCVVIVFGGGVVFIWLRKRKLSKNN